jgi:hypothetical protein
MSWQLTRSWPAAAIAISTAFILSGAEIQCQGARARPSLEGLQVQIDDLNASQLHVFDRNGVALGPYAGSQSAQQTNVVKSPMGLEVYLREHGILLEVDPERGNNLLSEGVIFYFEDVNCTQGTFSTLAGRFLQPNIASNDIFVVTGTDTIEIAPVAQSNRPFPQAGEPCSQTSPAPIFVVPVTQVDPETDLGLSFPLPAPLYVAPGS